jgi:hypothetical protein
VRRNIAASTPNMYRVVGEGSPGLAKARKKEKKVSEEVGGLVR